MLNSVEGTGKNQLQPNLESMGDDPVLSLCFCFFFILGQNRQVSWSIVMKQKPTIDSPFFVAFPSDCIPKGTKDILFKRFKAKFQAQTNV
jgi:hypothetical protein